MGANLILPAGSAAADSTPADPVTRSLRFESGATHRLTKTFGSAPTSGKVSTLAFWVKRSKLGSDQDIISANGTSHSENTNTFYVRFKSDDALTVYSYPDPANNTWFKTTSRKFRDVGAWMHIAILINTDESAAADKCKIYINGVREPSANLTGTNPSSGATNHLLGKATTTHYGSGNVNVQHCIGDEADRFRYKYSGYLADFYFVDGSAIEPDTNFIESTGYGSYKPKAFDMSSYGGNSWHLDMQPANDSDLLVSSVARNDGDTTFVDVANGHTITKGGDPEHRINVGNPFTGDDRAAYFDGSSDYLTSTDAKDDANFDNSDWTLEFWINPSNTFGSAIESFMGCGGGYAGWNSSNGHSWTIFAYNVTNQIYFQWWNGSSNVNMAADDDLLPKNTWTHVAVVNQSGTKRFYIGGVQVDTDSNTKAAVSTPSTFNIGVSSALDGKFNGHLYDVSIQRGYCKYEDGTAFTPPTSKITADSNTEFLLQPEKNDSSFEDESSNGHTVSTQGSPTTIASTPYEAAAKSTAISFDGTGDYLSVATSSDFDFGSGSYTYEGWFYFNGFSQTPDGIFSRNNSSTQEWAVCTNSSGTLQFFESVNNSYNTSSFTFSTGQWYHIALCKNGTTYKVYVDADEKISATLSSAPDDNLPVIIGRFYDNYDGYYLDGYCFDFRAQKGVDTGGSKPSAAFELNPVYIGGDQSGNKNHFQPTNISGHDVMRDTPASNFCTFSPISGPPRSATLSEGNLKVSGGYSGSYYPRFMGTVAVSSGKWFYEVRCGSTHTSSRDYGFKGVNTHWPVGSHGLAGGSSEWSTRSEMAFSAYQTGVKFSNSSTPATSGTTWGSDGDVIGLALDLDSTSGTRIGTLRVFKNGSEVGSATDIPTGGSTEWLPCIDETSTATQVSVANFGQDPTFGGLESGTTYTSDNTTGVVGEFHNPIPSGYLPFAAGNLTAPSVTPEENFDITLWQGNDTNGEDIDGLAFDPTDGVLTWIKNRDDSGGWHVLFDSVRGAGNQLATNETDSELASASNIGGKVSQWNTDGFRVAQGSGTTPLKSVNESSDNYVAWNWKAHQSPTSTRTTYTVKVEDSGGDAWDASSSFYDYSTYLPNVYMELWENRSSGLVSLGKVAVRSMDEGGNTLSDTSEQTYELKCVDLNAITVKWHYDTSGDGQEYDYPNSYNDLLNEQKITILNGTSSTSGTWVDPSSGSDTTGLSGTNNHSNDDGGTNYNYSPPTGWANGNSLKTATTSYTGTDTATLTSNSGPVEKYNDAAGFSIISYSGTGSSSGDTQALNHSLGVPLEFVIAKARTSNDSYDNGRWIVYHKDLTSGDYLMLNDSAAADTPYEGYDIISTSVSGSQHKVVVGNDCDSNATYCHYLNSGPDNGTGEDYILYGWAGVEGYSKFGTYEGGSDFIYTGHTPRWLAIKRINSSDHWCLYDTARFPANPNGTRLEADTATDEVSASTINIDVLSNGFMLRGSGSTINASGSTYIFASFASAPFAKATAR